VRLPLPRRAGAAALLLAVVAGLSVIVTTSSGDGLVYYRTPSELGPADSGRHLRVGGMVVPGSVVEDSIRSALVVTDGASDLRVEYAGRLPDVVREGQGAVVEGRLVDGSLLAESVVMRHSNEYERPRPESVP
jgi:cytochrome c-type biogenesis protein CcmE